MSNEIKTGEVSASLTSTKSQSTEPLGTQNSEAKSPENLPPSSADKVSMTDDVSRLQEIEGMLQRMPNVNNALVAEVSQLISEGKLEINLERIASNLLEAEAGVTDPGNR